MLHVISGFPTVILSIPLGVVIIYWLTVFIGLLDIDILDFDADVDGVDAGIDTDVGDGISEIDTGPLLWLINGLRIGKVPLTITMSLLLLFAWTISAMLTVWFYSGSSPLFAFLILAVSLLIAVPMASFAALPFEGLFKTHQAMDQKTIIGTNCTLTTGRVTSTFGQASWEDGGAGLIIQIRCDNDNSLKKGDEALIVSFSEKRQAFIVEPLEKKWSH